eukprot:359335-Chlamydomonas_euryale.AAC.4
MAPKPQKDQLQSKSPAEFFAGKLGTAHAAWPPTPCRLKRRQPAQHDSVRACACRRRRRRARDGSAQFTLTLLRADAENKNIAGFDNVGSLRRACAGCSTGTHMIACMLCLHARTHARMVAMLRVLHENAELFRGALSARCCPPLY